MNEQQKKIAGYLGIAQKAGKIAAGDNRVKESLLKGQARLVVLANNASQEVKETLTQLAASQQVTIIEWPTKEELGLIIGKSRRGALAVLDEGFARAIKKVQDINII